MDPLYIGGTTVIHDFVNSSQSWTLAEQSTGPSLFWIICEGFGTTSHRGLRLWIWPRSKNYGGNIIVFSKDFKLPTACNLSTRKDLSTAESGDLFPRKMFKKLCGLRCGLMHFLGQLSQEKCVIFGQVLSCFCANLGVYYECNRVTVITGYLFVIQ